MNEASYVVWFFRFGFIVAVFLFMSSKIDKVQTGEYLHCRYTGGEHDCANSEMGQ